MSQRIVIDTNVIVSGLRSRRGASHQILRRIGGNDFEMALSVPLALEYEDVLCRESSGLGLSDGDVEQLMRYWCRVAHLQEIHFLWRPALRDPRDDHVLELAVGAGCGMIVTYNIKDFGASAAFGIEAIMPVEVLVRIGVFS